MSDHNDLFIGILGAIIALVVLFFVVISGCGDYIPQERSNHEIKQLIKATVKEECLK